MEANICVYSNIGDYWNDDFQKKWPDIYDDWSKKREEMPSVIVQTLDTSKLATKEDFEKLRAEILELKELLRAAIRYDAATGQPECEHEDKVALIKSVAEMVGVDLNDLKLD
jgi:hypothetical protein